MSARPFKLKAFTGGTYGHVARTRSFATREACEREAEYKRRNGWTTRTWRVSSVRGA